MSFQNRWLPAVPVVMAGMAILWIVVRPTEESTGQLLSVNVEITPQASPTQTVRVSEPEAPNLEAAATAIPAAATAVSMQESGISTVVGIVDLSYRAGEAVPDSDDARPLPPGYVPPDLVTLSTADFFIRYDVEGARFLHFGNSILNQGLMPLEVHGTLNERTDDTEVKQRIYAADGSYIERLIGSFFYHPEHEHWHIDAIAEYQLWLVDSEGLVGEPIGTGRKASFCLRDDAPFFADPRPEQWADLPVFGECNANVQGISPGWIDIYDSNTPGQLIDITGLPDGAYALVSRANPDGVVYESDIRNNIAITLLEISGDQVFLMRSTSKLPPAFFLS